MGKTMAEKILGEHAGREVGAGDTVLVNVDLAYVQDGTGPLTFRQLEAMGLKRAYNPQRTIIFLDHASPSPRLELSNDHKYLREMAAQTGAVLSEIGNGISHHVSLEQYANPGEVIVGADSHTCTNGALGAFATGMGSTDVAVAIGLGKTWMRVPETIRALARGAFGKGVYAKDLILHVIGTLTMMGATYKALEFTGEAIESLDMAGRATLANMAVEAGAKVGMVPPDEVTRRWLELMGRGDKFRVIRSDPDAIYERTLEVDVSRLEPTVARPHLVDNVAPVGDLKDIHVDEVFIGTSCNGRLEDFHVTASILGGRKVKPGTRVIITPGSRRVLLEGLADGTIQKLAEAGALITGPGCGPCVGVHEGVPADEEVCLATQPRNFKGRMGNPRAFIYLASPAVAAASAVTGYVTDPREFL